MQNPSTEICRKSLHPDSGSGPDLASESGAQSNYAGNLRKAPEVYGRTPCRNPVTIIIIIVVIISSIIIMIIMISITIINITISSVLQFPLTQATREAS